MSENTESVNTKRISIVKVVREGDDLVLLFDPDTIKNLGLQEGDVLALDNADGAIVFRKLSLEGEEIHVPRH